MVVLANVGGNLIAQCPREGCDGSKAFFYQVQIRSADEPMTTFYKVGSSSCGDGGAADKGTSARRVVRDGRRIEQCLSRYHAAQEQSLAGA